MAFSDSGTRLIGVLLVFLLAVGLSSEADSQQGEGEQESLLPDPMLKTAEWMLAQDDPRTRSAGLLELAGREDRELDQLVLETVRATTDGAAMLWLAHACEASGLTDRCVAAGLDSNIIQFDSANAFSRVPLASRNNLLDVVQESERSSMYYFTLIETWFEALNVTGMNEFDALADPAYAKNSGTPSEQLYLAYAIAGTWGASTFSQLVQECRSSGAQSAKNRACSQLGNQLISTRESLFSELLGHSLKAASEQAGFDQVVGDQRMAVTACQLRALQPMIESMGTDEIRDLLSRLKRAGEAATWASLAEQHGIVCP